ncbi:MAG: DUF4956 domain-containing protein [Bacteroidia bacterium]
MDIEVFDKLGDKFFLRLLVDVVSIIVLIRFVYFKIYRKKDFFFTFFMFNITIFIITYLLNKVEMSMGAAFGLFAVFSLLRYRTENISEKDMTYLFIVIAIGLITASIKGTYFESLFINFIIIGFAFFLDGNLLLKNELVQTVQYENIENIKPQNSEILLADLKNRTGLDIHKVSIQNIDFLKDTAELKIYYYEVTKNGKR